MTFLSFLIFIQRSKIKYLYFELSLTNISFRLHFIHVSNCKYEWMDAVEE